MQIKRINLLVKLLESTDILTLQSLSPLLTE